MSEPGWPTGWMVSYDVGGDRARRRLARLLEAHGQRVLYSVFELPSTVQVDPILVRASLLADGGHLLCQPWCRGCRLERHGRGLEAGWNAAVILR